MNQTQMQGTVDRLLMKKNGCLKAQMLHDFSPRCDMFFVADSSNSPLSAFGFAEDLFCWFCCCIFCIDPLRILAHPCVSFSEGHRKSVQLLLSMRKCCSWLVFCVLLTPFHAGREPTFFHWSPEQGWGCRNLVPSWIPRNYHLFLCVWMRHSL